MWCLQSGFLMWKHNCSTANSSILIETASWAFLKLTSVEALNSIVLILQLKCKDKSKVLLASRLPLVVPEYSFATLMFQLSISLWKSDKQQPSSSMQHFLLIRLLGQIRTWVSVFCPLSNLECSHLLLCSLCPQIWWLSGTYLPSTHFTSEAATLQSPLCCRILTGRSPSWAVTRGVEVTFLCWLLPLCHIYRPQPDCAWCYKEINTVVVAELLCRTL